MSPSKFARWKYQMVLWRQQYGAPAQSKGTHDPTRIKAPTNRCAKCGSYKSLTRHHKGHEYYFACVMPDQYAARYIEFRAEDIVVLCKRGKRCHQRIHKLYDKIMKELWDYITSCLDEITYDDHGTPTFKWKHQPSFAALEGYRLRMVTRCDRWLARGNKKYKPRSYRNTRI